MNKIGVSGQTNVDAQVETPCGTHGAADSQLDTVLIELILPLLTAALSRLQHFAMKHQAPAFQSGFGSIHGQLRRANISSRIVRTPVNAPPGADLIPTRACDLPPGFASDEFKMPPPGSDGPGWHPTGLLREAVDIKRVEMELAEGTILERPDHPIQLRLSFYESNPEHRFTRALRRGDGTLAIVAAMKRFQPRASEPKPEQIAELRNIGREARVLELAGVDAAFVNTDALRYGCEVKEMLEIGKAVAKTNVDRGIPLARQDLIIHPIQIAEAAVSGASAVTICAAAALPDLEELMNAATSMGIEAIVECHTEIERDLAMDAGATLLYLTNRDRTTNEVHLGTAEKLREDIPAWILTMGGGGIVTANDAWKLMDCGFDAVVLGETLLQSRRAEGLIAEIRTQVRTTGSPFDVDFRMEK